MTKVKCEIYEKEYEVIHGLHLKKHGITKEQYQDTYPNAPLISDELRKKRSEAIIKPTKIVLN